MKLILEFLGTTLLKKLAKASIEVAIERTDNTWDDAILAKLKEYE